MRKFTIYNLQFIIKIAFTALFLYIIHFTLYTPIASAASPTIIEMTAEGFKPDTVTIEQNSKVEFVNKDSQPHWPASNVHPTHEIYPEFDPKRPIDPGNSWSFEFSKVGSWQFHDHLFPHFRGQIVVKSDQGNPSTSLRTRVESGNAKNLWEKVKKFVESILSYLKPLKPVDLTNFTNKPPTEQFVILKELSKQKGADHSWDFVKQTYQNTGGSSGNVHDLAHLVGTLIFEQKGFSGLNICSPDFAYGCYHGFLDSAFAKNLDHLAQAHDACGKLGPVNSGPVASCIHGIGHGVASFYSLNLPKSLSTCQTLTTGAEFCFDGVIMEYVRSAPESSFKKDDPLYPCDDLEQKYGAIYSFACGRNLPVLLMNRLKMNFDQVAEVCTNASSTPVKQACVDSMGFSLASSGEVDGIISGCNRITQSELVFRCTKAAAGELVFQNVPSWRQKAPAVCQSLNEGSSECQTYVNQIIQDYHR